MQQCFFSSSLSSTPLWTTVGVKVIVNAMFLLLVAYYVLCQGYIQFQIQSCPLLNWLLTPDQSTQSVLLFNPQLGRERWIYTFLKGICAKSEYKYLEFELSTNFSFQAVNHYTSAHLVLMGILYSFWKVFTYSFQIQNCYF